MEIFKRKKKEVIIMKIGIIISTNRLKDAWVKCGTKFRKFYIVLAYSNIRIY